MRPVSLPILIVFAALLAGCDDDPPNTPPDTGIVLDSHYIDDSSWNNDTAIFPDLSSTADLDVIADSHHVDTAIMPDLSSHTDLSTATDSTMTCPPTKPTGYCDVATAPVCIYGNEICKCITVCGGQPPPPGQTHHWVCALPQPTACPKSAPTAGTSCSPNGLKCKYGTCALTIADCLSGKWKVQSIPPPP